MRSAHCLRKMAGSGPPEAAFAHPTLHKENSMKVSQWIGILCLAAVPAVMAQPASTGSQPACPEKNLSYWQAFPAGGESDLSARHQQMVLKKKCPADRDHHPVQAGRRRRSDVGADEPAAGRRPEHRRHQPAAHRVPAAGRPGAVQDRRHHAGVLVPLHAGRAGGARVQPDQDLPGFHQGGEGGARQDHARRLRPEFGQPRARTSA